MRALVFDQSKGAWNETKGLWLDDVEKPKLGQYDEESVIIKMMYAGFCGSDRGIWARSSFGNLITHTLKKEGKAKRIIGHELLGEVVEAGSQVEEKFKIKTGDIVAAESHITCGKCYQCERKEFHVCADDIIIGISQDGCFAEYVKVPAKILWPTDLDKIQPEIAAIQEPFGNAVHAATKVEVKDQTVAIFGFGAIGMMTAIVARGLGAKRIIAIDTSERQIELARGMGFKDAVIFSPKLERGNLHDIELVQKIKDLTGGVGVDVAIEMSGFNSSVNNAVKSTRRGGKVVLFGLKGGDFEIESFEEIIRNGLSLHSVIGRELWRTWEITKKLLEDRTNGVQEKLKKYVLKDLEGSVVDFYSFNREEFEEKLAKFPKIVFSFEEKYKN